jgi:anti-sigma factor RsiW
MSHENFEHKLLQYFYSELSGNDLAELEAHLVGCEECRKEIESLKAMKLKLDHEFDQVRVESGVLERIMRASKAKAKKPFLSYLWPRPLIARMAVSFAVATMLFFVVRAGVENLFPRIPTNVASWPLAEQIGQLDQDLLITGSTDVTAGEDGIEDDNLAIAVLYSGLEPADETIDSLDEDIEEIEEISNGVFDL